MAYRAYTRHKPSRKSIFFLVIFALSVLCYEIVLFCSSASTAQQLQSASAVHFIDVGQGDSTLIICDGEAVLIDAGVTQMGQTVTDYLKAQHISKLSAVIATHPHEDHIGGLPTVLKSIPTDILYLPKQSALTQSYQSLLETAEHTGAAIQIPTPGETFSFHSDATLTFLSPMPDVSFENANLASIVCLLNMRGRRILFTGDAEQETEQALLENGMLSACDVLKVAHHGSDTSSTTAFLDCVRPAVAVISCAKYNDYGHPNPVVLERLAAHGTEIHITAQEGTYIYQLPRKEGENAA